MLFIGRMSTVEIALAACFGSLYTAFGVFKIFPIVGQYGQGITAAAVIAPLIGMLFGPLVGGVSTLIGGVISLFIYSSLPLSLVSGVFAALTSGLAFWNRRVLAVVVYLITWLGLFFYPVVGPAWLFPIYSWFQLVGLVILVSPLRLASIKSLEKERELKLVFTLFLMALAATLCGQVAGTLTLEVITSSPSDDYFMFTWTSTFLLYPLERVTIAAIATVIGAPLVIILRVTGLSRFWTRASI